MEVIKVMNSKRKTRKDGLYEATVRVDGKKYHFYGSTKTIANAKKESFLNNYKIAPLINLNISFSEWVSAWIQIMKNQVSASTHKNYEILMKKHIINSEIGPLKLKDLTPTMFRIYWQELLDSGLSTRTVIYIHTLTNCCLNQALDDGLIPFNPLAKVKRPKSVRKEAKALTESQISLLMSSITIPKLKRISQFALATGMRREEILGLRWNDVDFKNHCISINQTAIIIGNTPVISQTTKTSSSRRTISISPFVCSLLREQKIYDDRIMNHINSKNGKFPVSGNQDLVFCSQTGNILDPKYVSRKIKEFMNKCNLFEFTFHSFRHTHASYLLQRGVNFKVIQTRLGHSTFNTTMDYYSHVIPEMDQQAAMIIEDILK